MKLYYNPKSRATIAKWTLDECGVDYEIVPIDFERQEHKSAAFLAINPAGKLPALVDGEAKLFENAAICLYIADKFPDARLAPGIHEPLRGRYLSWLVYSTSQLEPAIGDAFLKVETHPSRGWTSYDIACKVIEGELGERSFLLGDWFTAADIMIGSLFIWKQRFAGRTESPTLQAYIERLLARPKAAAVRA